jgi:GlcNAc-P-P-Und epimerase
VEDQWLSHTDVVLDETDCIQTKTIHKVKILLTGASGFLGRSLLQVFKTANHQVTTLGRRASDDFQHDLANDVPVLTSKFDMVVHAAGKAHQVPKTELEAKEFYDVNVIGTSNLLTGLRHSLPGQLVFISSVAVYGRETGDSIDESAALAGSSPYARSKIEAEQLVTAWSKINDVPLLILRLPLVAGPDPPGNLGKMIRGIRHGLYFSVADGQAKRSVVLASDVGLCLLEGNGKCGVFNLADGYHPSFKELEELIARQLKSRLSPSIPQPWAKMLGRIGDIIPKSPINSLTIEKMTSNLTFNDAKAREELNWSPRKVIDHFKI